MKEIKFYCEQGAYIEFDDIYIKNDELISKTTVKSDWYFAQILLATSLERMHSFFQELESINHENKGSASLINENGNFEINFSVDEFTGGVIIRGIMIKSMLNDERLVFELKTYTENLSKFILDLGIILESGAQNDSGGHIARKH